MARTEEERPSSPVAAAMPAGLVQVADEDVDAGAGVDVGGIVNWYADAPDDLDGLDLNDLSAVVVVVRSPVVPSRDTPP